MVVASSLQYIHQLSRSVWIRAKLKLYRTSASTLGRELIKHPSCTVDFLICMFDDACQSWIVMLLCHSIEISISLERLFQSSPFVHHCKGKSMTYLEMGIFCSRFFLSKDCGVFCFVLFCFTHSVYYNLLSLYLNLFFV